jgi:epoxyqueuosine reductase
MLNKSSFTRQLKKYAGAFGADLIGITPATVERLAVLQFKEFLKEGRAADMDYLENNFKNSSPKKMLPGAKSVIVIGLNYYQKKPALKKGHGNVARYAYGRDYHKVIKAVLKKIEKFILEAYPQTKTRICVDSAPLFEKYFAVKAGLGFIGKNTTVINPLIGSFFVLGEIITDQEFDFDKPINGTCGSCERCLKACPTKALVSAGKMDARRCVSYLTIEKKGPTPAAFKQALNKCRFIFGCDICQEVCPYNKAHAKPTTIKDLKKAIAGHSIPLKEIAAIKTDEEFVARFAGSPLMRAKRAGLTRNARALK